MKVHPSSAPSLLPPVHGDESTRWAAGRALRLFAAFAIAVALMVLGACTSSGTASSEIADDPISEPVAATVAPTSTPMPTSTPNAAEIYRNLSPSIAFIETAEMTTGSGVLIAGGYVLTDHHVVEFSDTVRVVFPNGTEILEAPVFAQDPQSDLALVGPLDTALPEVAFTGVAPGVPGAPVYLLGYPDETESYPEVTITSGIVSRYRTMDLHGYDFVQVDALIAPGQSGGVLVNHIGEIVGLSGLRFGDGDFGLVMSAETVKQQVDLMRSDPTDFSLDPVGQAVTSVIPAGRNIAYRLESNGTVALEVESSGDISLELLTLSGAAPFPPDEVVDFFQASSTIVENFVDETTTGTETMAIEVQPGSYVLSIASFEDQDIEVNVTSDQDLFAYIEADEGQSLTLGEPSRGLYAHPADSDEWQIDLTAGERIRVRADSISDVVLVLRRDGVAVASGDDDNAGMFGTSVDFEYLVEQSGIHDVAIGRFGQDTGGYIIQIDLIE